VNKTASTNHPPLNLLTLQTTTRIKTKTEKNPDLLRHQIGAPPPPISKRRSKKTKRSTIPEEKRKKERVRTVPESVPEPEKKKNPAPDS
jgi:hypothetical protein